MKISINKTTGKWEADVIPSYIIDVTNNDSQLWLYGKPLLLDSSVFSPEKLSELRNIKFTDLIPRLTGDCFFVETKNGEIINFAVDFYGHCRMYMNEISEDIFISNDLYSLPQQTDPDLDWFQIFYFLNWDHTWCGGTFYKKIHLLTPTKVYKFINNEVIEGYLKMPKPKYKNIKDAITEVLFALSGEEKAPLMMLSGGLDSMHIASIAKNKEVNIHYVTGEIKDLVLDDNLKDQSGVQRIAEQYNLDINYVEVKIKDFYDKWQGKLDDLLPFEYKDGRLWIHMASYAQENGYEILMSGQNADAIYNYSYTNDTSIKEVFKMLIKSYFKPGKMNFSERLQNTGLNEYIMRLFSTDKFLQNVLDHNHYSKFFKLIWKNINKDLPLTRENYIAHYAVKGNGYPKTVGLFVSEAANENGKKFYTEKLTSEFGKLIALYDKKTYKTGRELLLVSKLSGYCQGEDQRAITEACRLNGISSFQIYTSAPILPQYNNLRLGIKDIFRPKYKTYREVNENGLMQERESINKETNSKNTVNASQVWQIIYNILDHKLDFTECIIYARKAMDESGMVNIEELKSVMEKDIGIKMRVAWFGLSLKKMGYTC
ncbi:asparagine synthase-related protein [Halobacillus sp. H74]|uniref:asparagine synthase-related protein n=1 Tax=Halobacillus sp. H74 TaxID=3457436 RepID=UPI003FCE5A28